jgi:hypothetical protein
MKQERQLRGRFWSSPSTSSSSSPSSSPSSPSSLSPLPFHPSPPHRHCSRGPCDQVVWKRKEAARNGEKIRPANFYSVLTEAESGGPFPGYGLKSGFEATAGSDMDRKSLDVFQARASRPHRVVVGEEGSDFSGSNLSVADSGGVSGVSKDEYQSSVEAGFHTSSWTQISERSGGAAAALALKATSRWSIVWTGIPSVGLLLFPMPNLARLALFRTRSMFCPCWSYFAFTVNASGFFLVDMLCIIEKSAPIPPPHLQPPFPYHPDPLAQTLSPSSSSFPPHPNYKPSQWPPPPW